MRCDARPPGSRSELRVMPRALAHTRAVKQNCDTNHRVYQLIIHGIGMIKQHASTNASIRHSTPQPVPMKLTCLDEPSTCRQIQRVMAVMTQAQPMMVISEIQPSSDQPSRPQ